MSRSRRGTGERLGRSRVDRTERREQLLDAALVAIRRDGPEASMTAIAAEGGITKPILYRHFGDRQGLVRALVERFAAQLGEEVGAALALEAAPRDVLVAAIDAHVRVVERDPQLYRFLTRSGGVKELTDVTSRMAAMVAVVLGERIRAAGGDSGAAEPWAHGLVGMVHQAADWWVDRPTMPRARLVEYLVRLLWDGLASYAPTEQEVTT
jgi:AcrR family transcriptional regulator